MDSPALTGVPKLRRWFTPLAAIVTDDLSQCLRHWAILLWGVLCALLYVIWFISLEPAVTEPPEPPAAVHAFQVEPIGEAPPTAVSASAAALVAKAIRLHLLVFTTLVVCLAASAIATEADILGESTLCRGISRWQYFAGKAISRMVAAVAAFILFTLPVVFMAWFRLNNDITFMGLWRTLVIGSMWMAGVAAISVAVSSWFRNPLLAAAVAWMTVYGTGIVFAILSIVDYSPLQLVGLVPSILASPETVATTGGLLTLLGLAGLLTSLVSATSFAYRDM